MKYITRTTTTRRRTRGMAKGIVQIDYIIAIGVFIMIFAVVVQYVSNYFSTVGDMTSMRVMTAEATSLLDAAERGYQPGNWPQQTANDSSVILLMHMDNSTLDSTRYGNNGTITGANCSAVVLGKFGNACSFDGTNQYTDLGQGSIGARFNDGSSVTFSAWIKYNHLNPGQYDNVIYQSRVSNGGGANLWVSIRGDGANAGKLLVGGRSKSADSFQETKSSIVLANSTWYHVVGIEDYGGGTINISINGVLDVSTSVTYGSNKYVHGGGDPTYHDTISESSYVSTYPFNGTIDEVEVWNRSLSSDEIYSLYAYESSLNRIGLATKAYRFYVVVNNTMQFQYNKSAELTRQKDELVKVNYTQLGFTPDVASTFVIDNTNTPAAYQISGNTIIFKVDINPNHDKTFTVYFDTGSHFAEQTTAMTGDDNLSDTIMMPQEITVLQYRKLLLLNNSNYTLVKNATQQPRDFSMQLTDTGTSKNILNFGPAPPPSGNVVSFRRYVLYQNSTGAIRRGSLVVQTW